MSLPTSQIQLITGVPKCRCRWIRRPLWYINPITILINVNAPDMVIPLKKSHLEAKILDSVASIKYTQTYENTDTAPIEALYKFPADPYFSVTGMHIKLEDKEIDAVIMEKEEAKEKYDDAVAAGHTAAKINYDENIPDVIELAIGSLQPGKTVTIDVNMIAKWDVIKHGFFSFIFPINFIPRFNPSPSAISGSAPIVSGSLLPGNFSCDITLESSNVISDLSVSHQMEYVQSEDGHTVTIKMAESSKVRVKDIVVSYSTEEIREPSITLHQSDKYPDEIAAHISFIPRVSDEHEVEEVKEEEKKEEDISDTKGISIIDQGTVEEAQDPDEPDVASGEFIFILDCSGSMRRNRITIAKEALKLFIQSLPSDSLFNIVTFGTNHKFMYLQSQKYTKEIIDQTLVNISQIEANMGGTVMLTPVDQALKAKSSYKYPKNVFLLTDGAIGNTEEVVAKIREHNHSARLHTFGIGSGASRYLVKETAKAGLGTSALIADDDPKIKAKIIQALKIAAKPAFTDIKLDWKDNQKGVVFQSPRAPIAGNIYEEEAFNIYAILKKSDLVNGELDLSFFNTFDQERGSLTLTLDTSKIIDSGSDDWVFKMAAKENMVHLRRATKAEEKKAADDEILKLSLKYSVLSEQTAFFGKIKNKDKSTEEMKTIEIPIKKMRDNLQYVSYGSNMRCKSKAFVPGLKYSKGAKPGGMMLQNRCLASAPQPQFLSKCAAPMESSNKKRKTSNINKMEVMSSNNYSQASFEKDSKIKSSVTKNRKKKSAKADMPVPTSMSSSIYSSMPISDIRDITTSKATTGYEAIIDCQSPEGFFSKLPAKYASLSEKSPPAELESMAKEGADIQLIWLTILAVLILEKQYGATKDEWAMIAKKARTYLKKNMQKGSDISQFGTHTE